MSQFSLIYLFVFIVITAILVYLLLVRDKTLQIKACIILLLFYMATLFCFVIYLSARDTGTMSLWLDISHYTGPVTNTLVLYLIVIFYYDDEKPPLWVNLCILLSVTPLLLRGMLGFMNTVSFIPNPAGNIVVYRRTAFFYYYYIHSFIIAFFIIAFLAVKYRTTEIIRQRKLSLFLLVSTGVTWVLSMSGNFLIPVYFKKSGIMVPATGYIFYSIIVISLFYALFKYSFMKNSIPYTISSIMSKISDTILITDTDGRILQANNAARNAFGSLKNTAGNINLKALFPGADGFYRLPDPEMQNRVLDVSIESIHDRFGDYIGKLVICRINNKIEELRLRFDLTAREIEIITFLYEGLEYQQIAERLKLSVNTVRNHIQNIYSKTGVNSKARLLKIAF